MSATIRAIVGLGNPGKDYVRTRHNAGFWFADALAAQHRAVFKKEPKFRGERATLRTKSEVLLLFKPTPFMNLSGEAVQALAAFHKIAPEQILIAHDDLDLPLGTARLKAGGGHGGHNGLRSIHQYLGEAYLRLRLGVGHPGSKERVHAYLTEERTPESETKLIRDAIAAALEVMPVLLDSGVEKAMQLLHSRLPPPASPIKT
ncbi:MAG: aminoacyl-tRNA hydrolase [Nevskiales bacterium]|nr:aminoacyl-tRNA hydrolase [Nevskiales bacterium]